ncbi:MAG: hypothetical protein KF784_04670 [Fimbriimonadaceae bacterium]|nr:hypothetical protein [Fimbriimonadaceae bacterium]
MGQLATLDWVVVLAFIGLILALGFSAKLRDNSVLQYLTAGRALTLPVFVATLVSTWYGGILGIAESVSFYGIGTWVMFGVPFYVFGLIYAFFLAKKVREADQISIPERLQLRYGRGVAVIGATLVLMLAVPAAHVLMLGALVHFLTGWSLGASVLIAAVVGTLFLYKGGLLADARVSVLAFLMMYVGFAVIVIWCLMRMSPGEAVAAIGNTPKQGHLLQWDGGAGIVQVVSFFIIGAWTLVDPGFHQRVASCKSPEVGKKGVLVSVGFWVLFDLLTISTGMYAIAMNHQSPSEAGALGGMLLFPSFGQAVLPSGLYAVFLCGMLGTIVSAMVGYTLVSGASIGRDIVARFKPGADDAHIKLWTRIGFGIATGLAITLALNIESVVSLWYLWSGIVVGALLIPALSAYGKRSLNVSPLWIIVSMVVSSLATLGLLIYGLRTGDAFLTVTWLGKTFSIGTLAPGLAISAFILGLGKTLAIIRGKHHG